MSAGGATVTPMDVPTVDELPESQADLNEYLAHMIMGEAFNERRYVDRALTVLTNHNLAARIRSRVRGGR
jgi:hypothetical protein